MSKDFFKSPLQHLSPDKVEALRQTFTTIDVYRLGTRLQPLDHATDTRHSDTRQFCIDNIRLSDAIQLVRKAGYTVAKH